MADITTDLNGARLKIERAIRFIDEVDSEFEQYNMSDPVRISHARGSGYLEIQYDGIPQIIGVIMGDVAHNLRSPLDILACCLVRMQGNSEKGVYFPFSRGQSELQDRISSSKFRRAGTAAVERILEISPCEDTNPLLYAVHDLNIKDKHRGYVETLKKMNLSINGSFDPVDSEFKELRISADIKHTFEDGYTLAHEPVVESLRAMARKVEETVDGISELLT